MINTPTESWIVHEDDHLLVVNKPSGLLTVPGKGDLTDCLIGRLNVIRPRTLLVQGCLSVRLVVVKILCRALHLLEASTKRGRCQVTLWLCVQGWLCSVLFKPLRFISGWAKSLWYC